MTTRQSRTVVSLFVLLAALIFAIGLVSLYHLGVARADSGSALLDAGVATDAGTATTTVVISDPVTMASADGADLGTILEQYGPIWGGAILLFALVTVLLKQNESSHWIAQGRALALITTALMGVGALVKWKLGGAALGAGLTPIIALAKLFNPFGPATVPTKP